MVNPFFLVNNIFMRGRILGIKKSYILSTAFVILSAAFLSLTPITIFVFSYNYLWFFIFCACCGLYQIFKGMLFHFDSAFYFGVLLLCVAGVGFYTQFSGQSTFQEVYYILSFAVASYLTFVFFGQKFQFYLAVLLYFNAFSWLLVKIKVLQTPIFVAICVTSVIIFILYYSLINKIVGKRRN